MAKQLLLQNRCEDHCSTVWKMLDRVSYEQYIIERSLFEHLRKINR